MEVVRQVLSVLLVFVLLGGVLWALRRGQNPFRGGFPLKGRSRVRTLETVERLTLTAQHSLHLVRVGGCEVVVATHPQGCALLIERPSQESNRCGQAAAGNELGRGANS